jgi:hypothetical protein
MEEEMNKLATLSRINRHFLAQWIFACAIGYAIGDSISVAVGEVIGYSLWETTVKFLSMGPEVGKYNYVFASAVVGAFYGGTISFSQWLVIRRYVTSSIWWVWVGLIGNSAILTLNSIVYTVISLRVANLSIEDWRFRASIIIVNIFVGAVIGVLEWLILRNTFPNSNLWIGIRVTANILVLGLSFLIAPLPIGIGFFIGNVLQGLASGVLVGFMSGFTLSSFSKKKPQILEV